MSKLTYIQQRLFTTKEKISTDEEFKQIEGRDRANLLLSQFKLRDEAVPIVILINGVHASGYSRILNVLNEWMDTRFIESHVHRPNSDEEADRPFFWKYWRTLPERGMTGLFVGGWYTRPFLDYLDGVCSKSVFHQQIEAINQFEQMLADDGVLLVKIWLELNNDEQQESITQLPERPEDAWRVTMDDWRNGFSDKKKKNLVNTVLEMTDKPHSRWYSVYAANAFERDISVMHLLTEVFEARLSGKAVEPSAHKNGFASTTNHLDNIDLTKSLKRSKYTKALNRYKEDMYKAAWRAHQNKTSVVLVFEGADAAGKGGTIRRLIRCLDARLYRVIQISAPTKIEKAMHYLWRFWMQIPRAGFITIYDRSWYGRVLVERVEGFAKDEEWQRAYAEINQFEKQLADAGIIVLKFWLQISDKEQLERFKKREVTAYKQYKLTEEDWRNRDKRPQYEKAANDMIECTNTKYAPWHLIPAEDKKYARISVLKAVYKALKSVK